MNKLFFFLGIIGFGLFFILSQIANAVPLELNLQPSPEIFLFNERVFYQSETNYFIAKGTPLILTDANLGGNHSIQANSNDYSLEGNIDSLGVLSSGTIQINGKIPELGFNSGTLLTGDLTQIGFGNSGLDPLEFKFVITSGDASSLYGGIGSTVGVVFSHLISPSSFETSFIKSLDTSRVGILETSGSQTSGGTDPKPKTVKPESEKPSVPSEIKPDTKIPEWVKNTMNWFVEGQVSEDEMINALQFLIKEGIIRI